MTEQSSTSESGTSATSAVSRQNEANTNGTRPNNSSRDTRKNQKNQQTVQTEQRDFQGKTKEIGGVLGLKMETLIHKVPFDTFREKLGEYVLKEFAHARHVISLIEDMEHPLKKFSEENKPKVKRKRVKTEAIDESSKKLKTSTDSDDDIDIDKIDDDDATVYYDPDDFVEKMLLETKIKAYVSQEEQLKNNISKIYVIIWGQCSSSLQAVIKGNNDYVVKHKR